jgi:hypothetical protein
MQLKKDNVPFTMVANEILKDPELSFKAKGLYAYLFSKPDTWDFSSNRMVMETRDGRKAIMAMLRELEDRGYLKRTRLTSGKMEYLLKYHLSPEMELGVKKPKSLNGTVPKSPSAESSPISNIDNTSNIEDKVTHISKTEVLHGNQWNELIDSFKEVNPMYLDFYKNTTERKALEAMTKNWGYSKLLSTIQELPRIIGQPYAPKITKPTELRRDIGKLVAFYNQEKNKLEGTVKKSRII